MIEEPLQAPGQGDSCPVGSDLGAKLDCIRQHLLAQPRDGVALGQAATLLYQMGRFREAAAHLEKALLCHPCPLRDATDRKTDADSPDTSADQSQAEAAKRQYRVLRQLGDCYAALSDCRIAERYYRAAAALEPADDGPYLGLGSLLLQQGRTDEAQRLFNFARQLQPNRPEAYGGLAMIHQQRQEPAAAFEMYLKCLELDGDNLVALLGLFQTSCQMGTFAKIIHYLEVYLSNHPTDTSVLFCLATLYAREGRLSEARQVAMRVLAIDPGKHQVRKLLSELQEALAQTGHRQGAAM